jgi:hypothetical protein
VSIQTQINRIKSNVSGAFAAIMAKGGSVANASSDNLAEAISTIPTMSGFYGFYANEEGHLILAYDTIEQPQFALDGRGHLIHTYTGGIPPLSINSDGHLTYTIGE